MFINNKHNIFLCSYINQRNRQRNIVEAENAFKVECAEMKTAKADPFTRRQCQPKLVTKAALAAAKAAVLNHATGTEKRDDPLVEAKVSHEKTINDN